VVISDSLLEHGGVGIGIEGILVMEKSGIEEALGLSV